MSSRILGAGWQQEGLAGSLRGNCIPALPSLEAVHSLSSSFLENLFLEMSQWDKMTFLYVMISIQNIFLDEDFGKNKNTKHRMLMYLVLAKRLTRDNTGC